jgi:hypothetical protein
MKTKIIEICELGQPQSIIHRENEPITELIKTDSLIEELNKQLTLTDVMRSNLALLWWGWTTVWGVIGFIVGCIKLWNYYA